MNVSSVEKAFLLLEYLAGIGKPASLNEVTQAAQLPKPTAYRLLRSLQELGYVARPAGTRDYALGPRATRLAALVGECDPYRELKNTARPLLEAVHARLDETVNLGVLSEGAVLYLDYVETTQPLRYIVTPGESDPFDRTALGRAIAAQLDVAELKAIIGASIRLPVRGRKAEAVSASLAGLQPLLLRVRQDGFAEEVEEAAAGVACLAVSLAPRGFPHAAVSVAVPIQRYDAARRKAVIDALGVFNSSSL